MKKTIFALIPVLSVMVVALLLVLPSAAAATPITTADQLLEIMNDSSKWGTSYVLANDIDLSTATNGMSQAPIGRSSATGNYYSGTFDGNGHSISGIDIDTGSTGYAGLFGYTNGTIKNLKIYGRVASTGKYTGGLVGVATSSARVMNVENHVTVVGGSESTGGLVGALVPKGGKTAAISNVANYGTVTGTKYVGGILGFLQSESGSTAASFSITGAINDGSVTATSSCAGGIAGYLYHNNSVANRFVIDSCENRNAVRGGSYVGGIVGAYGNASSGTSTKFTFSTLSNRGAITATTGVAGGIVGLSKPNVADIAVYQDCVNYGTVEAPYGAAGLISTTSTLAFTMARCYNGGAYTGTTSSATYPSLPILSKTTSVTLSNIYYGVSENASETRGTFLADPTVQASFTGFDFTDTWAMGLAGPEIRAFHTHNTAVPVSVNNDEHRLDCTCGFAGATAAHDFTDSVVCTVCGYDPSCPHANTHEEITVAATCVSVGTRALICDECGETLSTSEIAIDPDNHVDTAFVWNYDGATEKYYMTCSACAAAYGQQDEAPVVFVNGSTGDNANDGLAAESALATLTAAVSHIANCGGTVSIAGYSLSANEALPAWNGRITFTASTFDANGAATTGITVAKQNVVLTLGGDAKFDALLIRGASSSVYRLYIAADWHNLEIGYLRIQNYAKAFIFAGLSSIKDTDDAVKTVTLNLDMPALSTKAGDYFYERIYLGCAIGSASARIENKTISLTVRDGYINSKASTRTQSGAINTIYAMSTTANEAYNTAVVSGCTSNIVLNGNVVLNNLRTGDANTALYPAAVSLDNLTVTLNDNATIGNFWAKNVANGVVTISSAGRTVRQNDSIRFVKVGDFAEEDAALTLNYDTHSFAPTLSPYYAASAYDVTDNGVDVCTFDGGVIDAGVITYTCTVCGRSKSEDSFLYALPERAYAKRLGSGTGYLRILAQANIPVGKTLQSYGMAMIPTTYYTAAPSSGDIDDPALNIAYWTANAAQVEQLIASDDKTIHADLSGIPAGDYDTPIYAWVFAKFAEDSDYKIYPLGTFTVNGSYYNAPEVEEG